MLSPPLSAKTPLASLAGWTLVMQCPQCGERRKKVDDLANHQIRLTGDLAVRVQKAYNKYAPGTRPPDSVKMATRELGFVIPRLSCDHCKSKPTSIAGVCGWAPTPAIEDLTFLLETDEKKAA
jgi:hypothetical protein